MSEVKKVLFTPIFNNNPIALQILGICSALAVTSSLSVSFVMAIALTMVTAFSNLFISIIRSNIPSSIRIIVQMIIIASLVIVVDQVLKAFAYEISKQLSVFVGLIITNCIVMGRLEAFAMANKPWRSFIDGIGNGLGYGLILLIVAAAREVFGKGTFAGLKLIGATPDYFIDTTNSVWLGIDWFGWYSNNNLMVLPAAAMFVVGILIWIQRSYNTKLVDIS